MRLAYGGPKIDVVLEMSEAIQSDAALKGMAIPQIRQSLAAPRAKLNAITFEISHKATTG